ncbi:MAG: hypothetical protein WD029_10770 [Microthrixaceae bacterium]
MAEEFESVDEFPEPKAPAPVTVTAQKTPKKPAKNTDKNTDKKPAKQPAKKPVKNTVKKTAKKAEPAKRSAICASITQEMMNDLVLFVVGEGIEIEPLETSVALPGMGDIALRLALLVTGAEFDLRSEDAGRVRVIVFADGDVSTRAADFDGDVSDTEVGVPSAATPGMPVAPAPIPVRVEALVEPSVELRANSIVTVGLNLKTAELISLQTNPDAPIPDGIDPASWAGALGMFSMLFGSLGDGLFDTLGEHVGVVSQELDPVVGQTLTQIGVAQGPAQISVSSGLLTIALAAADNVVGRALPVPIAGKRVGLGLASSVVDSLSQMLILRAAGDLPLPFELDLELGEQQVGGRIRNTRLLPESFPDLRSSLRTEVRTRLLRGRLELSVQAAWLELPPLLPSFFNQLSRRVGELVSLAPLRVRFPARIELPVIPNSSDTIGVLIDDLRVTTEGLGLVVSLA